MDNTIVSFDISLKDVIDKIWEDQRCGDEMMFVSQRESVEPLDSDFAFMDKDALLHGVGFLTYITFEEPFIGYLGDKSAFVLFDVYDDGEVGAMCYLRVLSEEARAEVLEAMMAEQDVSALAAQFFNNPNKVIDLGEIIEECERAERFSALQSELDTESIRVPTYFETLEEGANRAFSSSHINENDTPSVDEQRWEFDI